MVAVGAAAGRRPEPDADDTVALRDAVRLGIRQVSGVVCDAAEPSVAQVASQAERDLRPVKINRTISSCFRSQAGAERFAHVRRYLSTTRRNDVGALDAPTCLFNDDPWMPPAAA